MVTVIVKVHVYCWKYHPCINWYNIFRVYIRIHVGMRIYNELIRVYILPTLKLILTSSVEYCSISNVNSLYQCSCKQCCATAIYARYYSVINPCGYWTSGTLSALASTGNTLYNVMGVKRHIMPVDLRESESIIGAEINLTVCAVNFCVLCWNEFGSEQICVEDVLFKTLS